LWRGEGVLHHTEAGVKLALIIAASVIVGIVVGIVALYIIICLNWRGPGG
jgi:hypothetical protein